MTTAVIGAAFGYKTPELYPFVISLRKHYTGYVCFLVKKDLDSDTGDFLRKYCIDTFPMDEPEGIPAHIQWKRWLYYQQLLQNLTQASDIFITDVRDVFFQKSPFTLPLTTDLEFFQEEELLKNCSVNIAWLSERYSWHRICQFYTSPIVCSGTVRSTLQGAFDLMGKMNNETKLLLSRNKKPWDQAQLNYLLYTNSFHNYKLVENGLGTVMTLHFQHKFVFDKYAFLLDKRGNIVPVIHQWDRAPDLESLFERNWKE